VSEVDGVRSVDVDLDSGRLSVSGQRFTDAAVKAAVEEAGYELAPRLTRAGRGDPGGFA
jgi:copper chaperone